jgi:hypothetical protein
MRETGYMRTRRPLLAILCALASLLVPGTASASSAAGAETRVGVFDLQERAFVWAAASLTLELHPGCEPTYDQLASDSLLAAKGGARYSDDLVKAAQSKFPGKAGKIEQHHVTPKYLGGDPKGPTVPIDAAYHQEITNAFREAWPYGQGAPSPADLQRIMNDVYARFPLPGGP